MNRPGLAAVAVLGLWACADEPSMPPAGPDAGFISADTGPEPQDTGVAEDADVPTDAGLADADIGSDAEPMDADVCLTPAAFTVSATTAEQDLARLLGPVISLTGTATRTTLSCSERECPADNPCCNDCTARIRVGDVLLRASPCYERMPGCAGSECSQTCRPPLFGLPQTFRGVLSTSTPDLELLLYEIR